ncbi:MAG: winged helix-turn-helix transcriptional regulator [Candidatus Lokiarchaeota archaeon]|nr:winged helix-turn-helix transcriptional regulator [Candidatus Lokiarchaeota archaeon]
MAFKKSNSRKRYVFFFLCLIIFELNFIIIGSLAEIRDIPGNSVINQKINQNEHVIYNFSSNSVLFGMFSDSDINISIDLESSIYNRETFMLINNNNNSLVLNFTLKSNIAQFGLQRKPKNPQSGNFQYKYQYNYVMRIWANISIQNITFRYIKNSGYGLNPKVNYKIAVFSENQESWEIVTTEAKFNDTSGNPYIEGELLDLDAEQEYYITLYEVSIINYDWIWIFALFLIIGIFGLVILISKREYLLFLKNRTIPIDKGVHNLTLEDVLENENRNKIIDFVLEEPGIHFNELLRKTQLSAGNLAWHLDILETYKVIGKKRIDRYLVYFPYYDKNPISNIDLKLQKSELTLKILEMIEKQPGIYNKILSNELKVDHKTISYHVNKLVNLNLVSIEKEGRKKKIYPNLDAEYYNNHKSEN